MHFRDLRSRLDVAWQEGEDAQEVAVADVRILLRENREAGRLQQYRQPCGAVRPAAFRPDTCISLAKADRDELGAARLPAHFKPGTCVDGRRSARAAHPGQQWTHEPNCTGQRGQWISGQTDEDGIFEPSKGKRFARLHRDLVYGKFGAEVAQGVADAILFADRDSCRGQNEIRVDGRMPERRPHRGHVVLDDGVRTTAPLACSSAPSIGRVESWIWPGARHSPGPRSSRPLDSSVTRGRRSTETYSTPCAASPAI